MGEPVGGQITVERQEAIVFYLCERLGEAVKKLAEVGGNDYTGSLDWNPIDGHPLSPVIGYSEETMRRRFGAVRVKEVEDARASLEAQFPGCRIPEYFVCVSGVNYLHSEGEIDDGARVRFLWQIDQARWYPMISGHMGPQLRIGREVQVQENGSLRFRDPVPGMVVCSEPLTAKHQKGLSDAEALKLKAVPHPSSALAQRAHGVTWGLEPVADVLESLPDDVKVLSGAPWTTTEFLDGDAILAALPAYIRSWVLPAAWHSQ